MDANYFEEIRQLIAPAVRYPPMAVQKGLEGVCKVKVEFARSGDILGVSLIQSTGHQELDRECRAAFVRIARFPRAPAGVSPELQELAVELPITFGLNAADTRDAGASGVAQSRPVSWGEALSARLTAAKGRTPSENPGTIVRILLLVMLLIWQLWSGRAFYFGMDTAIDSKSDQLGYLLVIVSEIALIAFLIWRA